MSDATSGKPENPLSAAPFDPGIRTYVLRSGRMTDAQKQALEELADSYCIPFERGRSLDARAAFGADRPLVAEIGFGMGAATWMIAQANAGTSYLGIEVHRPGIGKLLSELRARSIDNVRIVAHDAVEVFESMLPAESLAGIHIFYPDPWPKKRHHKRRLIRPGLAELLASRLARGSYLYFVTDIEDYAHWSLEVLSRIESLRNPYADFAPRQPWRPQTKFEARASRDGRRAWELLFEKG